jgi:photosystem II stability/assembly factor-like uncharacterized protein
MKKTGDTLILGTRKGLLWFTRKGQGFELAHVAHAGNPIAYAQLDPRTRTAWACIDHGHWGQKLSRSRDGGATWDEVAAPKYPEGATYLNGYIGMGERNNVPATLRYLWTFAHGGDDQPGRLYLGTEPGGLFVSDDDGGSWKLCEGLWNHPSHLEGGWSGGGRDNAGIHSVLVDPRNSKRVLVGVSCAGVFETTDDTRSWRIANKGFLNDYSPDPTADAGQDPHCVSWCAGAPDAVWVQHHCGIFASEDGAKNWRRVSEEKGPARFGFPIVADERDAKTAWVVPANSDQDRSAFGHALSVARTTDGGKTWTTLRKGLPQENCFDIVYRHALDLAGDTLAFGSTTGNAYVSFDRGESWQTLGNNFAPIYSVRLA